MSVITPNGKVFTSNQNIITYGLTREQNELISKNLPNQNYELYNTDEPTDLIAIPAVAIVINVSKLDKDSIDMLVDYYTEVEGCTSETIIWFGNPKPPKAIQKFIKYNLYNTI